MIAASDEMSPIRDTPAKAIAIGPADKFGRRTVKLLVDGETKLSHHFDPHDAEERARFGTAAAAATRSESRVLDSSEFHKYDPQRGFVDDEPERIAEAVLKELNRVEAEEAKFAASPSLAKANATADAALPHSREAESGVIGSVILDPRLLDEVMLNVSADEFYSPAHRIVWQAIVRLHADGRPVDTTLLVDELRSSGNLEIIGGTPFLTEIIQSVPTAHNAIYYARIVRDKARCRAIAQAALETLQAAYGGTDAESLLAQSEQKLAMVRDGSASGDVELFGAASESFLKELDRRLAGDEPKGITTGLPEVDRILGAIRGGEMIVAAARPGMGKTAGGLQIAITASEQSGETAIFISLEMGRSELVSRALSARSGVDGTHIRDARLTAEEQRAIIEAQADMRDVRVAIDDTPRRSAADIAAIVRRVQRKTPVCLLVIDYIGLIQPDNRRDPRQEQVAAIARRLKLLAKECNIPVLVLAQLNREVEKGTDHRPKLSHLRESGAIEQDADVVLLLHRPEAYRPDDADLKGKAEIIVAKNRRGPTGIATVGWKAETAQFFNLARGEEWSY